MPQRIRRLAIGTVMLWAFCATSAQAADTISIAFGADPTEEVPLPVSATWSTNNSPQVYVTVKPAGGLGCAPNYNADAPNSKTVLVAGYGLAKAGTTTANSTFGDPGDFTLCAYLADSSTLAPLAASGPVALTVRSAKTSIAITAPARVDAAKPFALSFAVTAELPRRLFVTVKPDGGRPCGGSYALDRANAQVIVSEERVQGTQIVQSTPTSSQTEGPYLLCGYVQESSDDATPEATSSGKYLVGPDPCVTARRALSAAERAVHVAETSVSRNRAAWKRYTKAARHSHGATRTRYRGLAVRAHSRYHSAVRRRAAVRATLATRQTAVTHACGAIVQSQTKRMVPRVPR
jgi:hypothetical protein